MGQPTWAGRGTWEFHRQNREGAAAWRRGSRLLGTPGLSPTPDQAHWENQMCACQVVSLGPVRTVGRENINSFVPQVALFIP